MRRSALVVAIVLVLLGPTMAVTPVSATPTHDETVIEIQIQPNGDAVWTVAMRYNLSDENDTAAFERIRSEYESGTSNVGPSGDLFRDAAARVATQTGREMAIAEVTRSSAIEVRNESQLGILTLSFTWTNFATVEGDRISVGSAFAGGWFGDLTADQTLSIEPPSGYVVQTASPSTDIIGGALQWEGPQTFDAGEPSVEFQPPSTSPPPPTTTPPQNGIPWTYAAIAFAGLVFGGLVLLAWQGGYLGSSGTGSDQPSEGGGIEPESQAAPGDGATASESMEDTAAGPPPDADTAPEEGAQGDQDDVDTELLSDEERVEHLLERHGGRMKQAQIVDETRWSNAKVSQLLSSMAEEGRVEKLRIGRENLISLPDEAEEQ